MTLNSLDLVYPDIVARFKRGSELFHTEHPNLTLKVIETLRPFDAQLAAYEQGRSRPGKIITHSPPGASWHQFGCALDVGFEGIDPYLERMGSVQSALVWDSFGACMEAEGLVWGGNFYHLADLDHLELSYGMTLKEANDLIQGRGGVLAVWKELDRRRECGTIIQ